MEGDPRRECAITQRLGFWHLPSLLASPPQRTIPLTAEWLSENLGKDPSPCKTPHVGDRCTGIWVTRVGESHLCVCFC
jgi:hypothetical protein